MAANGYRTFDDRAHSSGIVRRWPSRWRSWAMRSALRAFFSARVRPCADRLLAACRSASSRCFRFRTRRRLITSVIAISCEMRPAIRLGRLCRFLRRQALLQLVRRHRPRELHQSQRRPVRRFLPPGPPRRQEQPLQAQPPQRPVALPLPDRLPARRRRQMPS